MTHSPSIADFQHFLMFYSGCEDALSFYESLGLGRVSDVRRYDDPGRPPPKPGYRGTIAMARFEGPKVRFLAGDADDAEPMRGFCHVLIMQDEREMRDLFERLAHGGQITTPLVLQPRGDLYGKLTDRFGVQWALNCTVRHAGKGE